MQAADAESFVVAGGPMHPGDAAAVAALSGVVRVHVNDSHWWQNASFAFPALGAAIALVAGALFGLPEATGFGLFLVVVTLVMLPVVLLTWRGTPTAIALTGAGAVALHRGRILHELRWGDLRRIERVEYLGNVRHKLVHGDDERFLSVESEIAEPEALVDAAFELSGLERGTSARGDREAGS